MKIFLSSLPVSVVVALNNIDRSLRPNVLLTYYDLKRPMDHIARYRHMIGDLILDSGAFSLNNIYPNLIVRARESQKLFQKYEFDLPLVQKHYDFVFNFDDQFGPNSFSHNLSRLHALEAKCTMPVPVLHNLANHEADYFINNGYNRAAIGQCHAQDREDLAVLWPVVDKLYHADVDVHLFGMTTPGVISHVSACSCDSKTWLDYAIRGRILHWNPLNPKMDKTDIIYIPKDQEFNDGVGVHYNDYKHLTELKKFIESRLGIKWREMLGIQRELNRQLVNVMYFLDLEERITRQQLLNGITFD